MTEAFLKSKSMRFTCKNEERGCRRILDDKAMVYHESECIYRLVKCFVCWYKVPVHELLEHMKAKNDYVDRKYDVKVGAKVTLSHTFNEKDLKSTFCLLPIRLHFDNRVFLFVGKRRDLFYCWIQLIGSEREAKNYYYTLEFHGTDPNTRHVYTTQVMPIDETSESIIAANKCFGIKFSSFKTQFVHDDFRCKFSISLRNMKEEAKDDNEESGISDDDN